MKLLAIVPAMIVLGGCEPTVGTNAERPAVSASFSRPDVSPVADVQITEDGPMVSSTAKRVNGTSCRNKMWDPAPSEENAMNLMKAQAKEMGFNAVHSVTVKQDVRALMKNCWSAINATGIAYNLAPAN